MEDIEAGRSVHQVQQQTDVARESESESVQGFLSLHREELIDMVESRFDLLSHLVAKRVINNREEAKLRTKKSVFDRNELLMKLICKKSEEVCRNFVEALENTAQRHVANYIQGDVSTDQRPLETRELSRIRDNVIFLDNMLDVKHGFLDILVDSSVITQRQMYHVRDCPQSETNYEFLSIISRRSFQDYKSLIACLKSNGQNHVAQVLEDGICVAAEIHLRTNPSLTNPPALVESELTRQVREILQQASADETRTIEHLVCLKMQGIDLQAVGTGSIILYFRCHTKRASYILHKWIVFGRLKKIIDKWFSSIMGTEVLADVKLKLIGHLRDKYKELIELCNRVQSRTRNVANSAGSSDGADCKREEAYIQLPVELLEMLLMKTFLMIFVRHLRTDGHVSEAEQLAYRTLSSVCSDWWQTLKGWPQSNTKHWVKHRLQYVVKYVCRPYRRNPQLVKQFNTKGGGVCGLTQMYNKLFVVCWKSNTIEVFGLNYEQLEDIEVKELKHPTDIVACSETRSLYVSDRWSGCVWRLSADGLVIKLTTTSRPWSLSVTSGRLLVTTDDALLLYGDDGLELKRFSFKGIHGLTHAVETSDGTFVFCHVEPIPRIVEADSDGRIITVYDNQQKLTQPWHLSFDSEGQMFTADFRQHHILLLTSNLQLDRVLLDIEHDELMWGPRRLFYVKQTRQLIVGGWVKAGVVQVFAVG